ncbi:NADP-dependent oxidoreductase [Spiractinospora alimapuensis]|nr:NADP-dependent oxidoreductase [Spiractinospora alimapuensis]
MRAAVFNRFGSPEVLQVAELPVPEPGPGEVRVAVRAAGVQPIDTAVRRGEVPWAPKEFPRTLGNEFAGVVDAVGDDVAEWAVGDEVIGWAMMTCYAEYTVVSADQMVAKPAAVPWEVAGVLSASGQTADTALESLGVSEGETLLVHAAAGGVGTYAVQLAVHRGATVIGTASPRNHEYLRSLGATPVSYGEGLVERVRGVAPRGVDVALDAAGPDALRASVELVADRRRIGTITSFDLVDEYGVQPLRSQRSPSRLRRLADLYAEGALQVAIAGSYDLADAAEAHRQSETGHLQGKIVLTTR